MRLLEHYTSVQGEGPRTGMLTQFVRFAGCNLKCPLWPCDTPEAIDPKLYRTEQQEVTPNDIIAEVVRLAELDGSYNICITGGEPMLQPNDEIDELVRGLRRLHYDVEMFTNGTLLYTDPVLQHVSIVMDWKLPGSGEDYNNSRRIVNYEAMRSSPRNDYVIKFTAASEKDLETALWVSNTNAFAETWEGEVWIGPVWDQLDPKVIVEFIKEHRLPWRLNLQTHKLVYGNVRSV
jgi:7-carboxy-7-deazaguanine synthase